MFEAGIESISYGIPTGSAAVNRIILSQNREYTIKNSKEKKEG